MDSLSRGPFRIVLAAYPNVSIGADNCDNCAVKSVITGGEIDKWTLKNDCLVLNDIWYCSHEDDKLVVRLNPDECTKWEYIAAAALIQVKLPGSLQVWTVTTADPKKPVVLARPTPVDSEDVKRQLMHFLPCDIPN